MLHHYPSVIESKSNIYTACRGINAQQADIGCVGQAKRVQPVGIGSSGQQR